MTNSDNESGNELAGIRSILRETAEVIRQGNQQQQDQHERTMRQLDLLRDISERQADAAQRNADTVRQFATIIGEQARTVASITRSVSQAIEASRASAQASQAAAVLAQSNQEANRVLIVLSNNC
jgi:predicted phage tail protein